MLDFTLDELFPSYGRNEFLENYLKNAPVIEHVHPFHKKLSEISFLNSIESLIEKWPDQVNAYKKGIADEVNSLITSPENGFDLFKKEKRGLFFDDPNRFIPELNIYLDQLRNELGLASFTYSRSLIYLIPQGTGTDPHFDQNINFIFQLKGTKKWWLAPNQTVINPLERFTIGHEASSELSSYSSQPFPTEFPDEHSIEVELKPGSLLFLPRGVWHKTFAEEDALSLNFTFTAPTWLDIMMGALRSRLAQSPYWRETAHLLNDPNLKVHSEALFQDLLKELILDTKHWSASDILKSVLDQ